MENVKYIPGDLMKHITTGKICKLINISIDRDYIIEECDTHTRICTDIGKLSSIPLTPQILMDNGWEKVHQEPVNCCNKYRKFRNVDLTYNIQTKTFFFEMFNIAGAVVVRLPYVHTLQHLLFGLGLSSELNV